MMIRLAVNRQQKCKIWVGDRRSGRCGWLNVAANSSVACGDRPSTVASSGESVWAVSRCGITKDDLAPFQTTNGGKKAHFVHH